VLKFSIEDLNVSAFIIMSAAECTLKMGAASCFEIIVNLCHAVQYHMAAIHFSKTKTGEWMAEDMFP